MFVTNTKWTIRSVWQIRKAGFDLMKNSKKENKQQNGNMNFINSQHFFRNYIHDITVYDYIRFLL